MLKRFSRLSITTQASLILAGTLAAVISTLVFWAHDNAMEAELAHARTVTDMADSFRSYVAEKGGLYVKRPLTADLSAVGRYLETMVNNDPPEGVQPYAMHRKPPFAAVLDFSDQVGRSPAAAKFRITSDNPLNRANNADLFELQAITTMRQNPGKTEFWTIQDGNLRYARVLVASQACLSCHGAAENAPQSVRAQFPPIAGGEAGGGYGWKVGDVVGVTSASMHHKTLIEMLGGQGLGFWFSASILLILMLAAFLLVVRGLVKPLRDQAIYANRLAESESPHTIKAPASTMEHGSGNEIHKAGHAIGSLHETVNTLNTLMRDGRFKNSAVQS